MEDILKLRQEFESHNHDGINSRTFQTVQADTISTGVILIKKNSYTDTAAGFWAGLVAGTTMKFNLGNSTDYIKWTGAGLDVSVSVGAGITISQTSVSDSSLKFSSIGATFLVGNVQNASIYLSAGASSGTSRTLTFQLSDISGGVLIDFNQTGTDAGNFSPGSSDTINLGTSSRRWSTVYCVTLDQSSDRRLKTNIRPSSYGLETVLKLKPSQFKIGGSESIGFIADELAEVVPEIVQNLNKNNEFASIRPIELIPILVKAIQDLDKKFAMFSTEK